MIKQVIQQLRVPDAGIEENLQERRYWLQCGVPILASRYTRRMAV